MPIMPFALRPPLSGGEVMVDSPDQRRPLQPLVRAAVAAPTEAQAEVPPTPLGGHPLQPVVVSHQVDQDTIQLHVEDVPHPGTLWMPPQRRQRLLCGLVAVGMDHGPAPGPPARGAHVPQLAWRLLRLAPPLPGPLHWPAHGPGCAISARHSIGAEPNSAPAASKRAAPWLCRWSPRATDPSSSQLVLPARTTAATALHPLPLRPPPAARSAR